MFLFAAWFAYSFNKSYVRLIALRDIVVRDWLREEIATGDLGEYFQMEYQKAITSLGNVSRRGASAIRWENYDIQALFERWFSDFPVVRFNNITSPPSSAGDCLTITYLDTDILTNNGSS